MGRPDPSQWRKTSASDLLVASWDSVLDRSVLCKVSINQTVLQREKRARDM